MVKNLQECKKCGEQASGDVLVDVKAALKRHKCKSQKKVRK